MFGSKVGLIHGRMKPKDKQAAKGAFILFVPVNEPKEAPDPRPRGDVVVRDIAGVAPSEVVRVVKVDTDTPRRGMLA